MFVGLSGQCFAEMLINFRFGKFWHSVWPFFSKGHAEFFREILADLIILGIIILLINVCGINYMHFKF